LNNLIDIDDGPIDLFQTLGLFMRGGGNLGHHRGHLARNLHISLKEIL
jgi:hypothetical protein